MERPLGPIECGIDIVSITRINQILEDFPRRFKSLIYTANEQSYCEGQPFPEAHFAARWTVKEAFFKCIGEEAMNLDFTDIEIIREPSPHLSIHGNAREHLATAAAKRDSDINDIMTNISLSHDIETDIAIGIATVIFYKG